MKGMKGYIFLKEKKRHEKNYYFDKKMNGMKRIIILIRI